jgi:hypothetical protein
MKRGLSQVVSIMLLIVLGVIVIGGIFIWQSGFLETIQKDAALKKLCSTLEFRADGLCFNELTLKNKDGTDGQSSTNIKFDVINDANSKITGFLLMLIDESGNSKTISIVEIMELAGQQGFKFTTEGISNTGNIKKVSIIPQTILDEKTISCYDRKKIINKEEITQCSTS